jgi:hypothetical protein
MRAATGFQVNWREFYNNYCPFQAYLIGFKLLLLGC